MRRPGALDPLTHALRQLGARLDGASARSDRAAPSPVAAEVLVALQALATGGTLWDAGQPARVFAARSALSAALQLLLEPPVDPRQPAARRTPIATQPVDERPPLGNDRARRRGGAVR
jgi:hypothetical protein